MNVSLCIFLAAAMLMCFQSGFYSGVKALYGKGRVYTVSKMLGCVIYTALCLTALFLHGFRLYGVIMLCGMVLGAFGDYYLSLASKGRLKLGIAFFLCGHLLYIAAFTAAAGFCMWVYAAVPVIVGVLLLIMRLLKFKFHGVNKLVIGYTAVITLMTGTAVSALYTGRVEHGTAAFIAAGAVLFFVSDILWAAANFSSGMGKKASLTLKILNVVTYFPAQLLLAGSLLAEHMAA